jgi:hypothetical protein
MTMGAMRRFGLLAVAAVAAGLAMAPSPARAEDPDFLVGSVGWYDMNRRTNQAAAFNMEYRSDYKLWIFKPFGGFMATTDGAAYGYAGLGVDVFLGRRLVLTGNTAFGAYENGDGKDLGHWIEFRSGLELAYRFDDRSRLGVGFHHISNAGIGDINPGTEILSLFYALPFGRGN